MLPALREPLRLRFGEQNLHISAAGFRPRCRPAVPSLCSPLPANPCSSVSGSKIFTFPSSASPSRPPGGALSLLPAPRKPLQLRSGEQNLHISAVGFRPPRRSAALSLCSPLPANPCSSISGSKIFTFPPPDFVLPGARRLPLFAPRYPQTLAAPFRGAKSSHFRRRISPSLPPGGALSLLPATRKPLQLRSGEQNLHISAAGSPPDFVLPGARRPPLFAPRSPRALVAPFRGAKSSHFRRPISSSQAHGGLRFLLPALREPLWLRSGEQNLHISAARFRPLCRPVALCFQRRYRISPKSQSQPPPDCIFSVQV